MVILIGNGAVGRSVGAGRKTGAANSGGSVGTACENGSFSHAEICVASAVAVTGVLRDDLPVIRFFIA